VDRAFYSVPLEYLGREVWVRWDGRMVRILNQRMTPITSHPQQDRPKLFIDPSS